MRIIVSGGGTGGHIYPAITIINTIREKCPEAEFLYVGTPHGLEADIVPKEGLPFATVDLQGFERRLTPRNLLRAGRAMAAVAKAAKIVRDFRPDVVIGTGGYVCGPILMAASLKHIPTMVQEQNVLPGITNKLLSRFVSRIAVGSEAALPYFPAEKTVYTGNPIRRAVMEANREEGARAFGFDPAKKTVLISGGSRGARAINRAMIGVLVKAAENPQVQMLHATGAKEYDDVISRLKEAGLSELPEHIKVVPYLYNMPQAQALADLAVFRAGATGLSELTARGIPSILVPYPYAAENHQEFNARALEKEGAARVILNKDLTAGTLGAALEELLADEEGLKAMSEASRKLGKPEAADEIAEMVLTLAQNS